MAVDRDHAPDDEIPPLPQVLERHVELVGVRRRAVRRSRRLRMCVRVGDRHDREARLDRLRVDERHLRRRRVDGHARRRRRAEQRRVRERRRRQRECRCGDGADDEGASHRTLQRERCRQHVAVDEALEKQPPRSGHGHEDADRELAGRRRGARHLRAAERARAAARSGRAHVRVEVVERSRAEEDRVRECSEPGGEVRRRSVRRVTVNERNAGWIARRRGAPCSVTRYPSTVCDQSERRQRLRRVRALDAHAREELEVRLRRRLLRIDVDDDAIRATGRKRDRIREGPVSRDVRMVVDDRAEIVADVDHVHARVRPGSVPELREVRAVGLLDRERDLRRLPRGRRADDVRRQPELARGLHRDRRRAARPPPQPASPTSARSAIPCSRCLRSRRRRSASDRSTTLVPRCTRPARPRRSAAVSERTWSCLRTAAS